ncbi:hypothetical protein B0H11DRAFT_2236373 [Mycena galericulata]|nr:hypothetical protein B0H11DRAFT_2236373 [Mycena galericulata]
MASKHSAADQAFLDGLPGRKLIEFRNYMFTPSYITSNAGRVSLFESGQGCVVVFVYVTSWGCQPRPTLSATHRRRIPPSSLPQGLGDASPLCFVICAIPARLALAHRSLRFFLARYGTPALPALPRLLWLTFFLLAQRTLPPPLFFAFTLVPASRAPFHLPPLLRSCPCPRTPASSQPPHPPLLRSRLAPLLLRPHPHPPAPAPTRSCTRSCTRTRPLLRPLPLLRPRPPPAPAPAPARSRPCVLTPPHVPAPTAPALLLHRLALSRPRPAPAPAYLLAYACQAHTLA